jgi:hypothetical protein
LEIQPSCIRGLDDVYFLAIPATDVADEIRPVSPSKVM